MEDGRYGVKLMNRVTELPEEAQKRLKAANMPAKEILLGIRPEHISVVVGSDDGGFVGQVDVSEMMGSEIHLHVNADGQDVVLRVPTTDLPEKYRTGITHGTEVRFSIHKDLIHLFDKETENNLLPLEKEADV